MKRMYGEAGIATDNKNIVNHSGRVTCCTRLFNNGFDEQMITGRSGHRSNAVRLYKRPSVEQEKFVSLALDAPQDAVEPPRSEIKPVKTEQSATTKTVHDSRCIRIELPDGIDTVVVCKNGRETSITLP